MKKILTILIFTLILSSKSNAEKINLACSILGSNVPPYNAIIDTEIKKISWQGSGFDFYNLENDVFYFVMANTPNRYTFALNRNTGHLVIRIYEFTDEQIQKIFKKIEIKMLNDKKTLQDKSYITMLMYDAYEKQTALDTMSMQCDRVKAKF